MFGCRFQFLFRFLSAVSWRRRVAIDSVPGMSASQGVGRYRATVAQTKDDGIPLA